MKSVLKNMVEKRKIGLHSGIPSFCCASKIVIEAILEQALRFDDVTLIEATSNQVNQFGGYMNMRPSDFCDYVYEIADRLNVPKEKIIIGGDHLGPLPWAEKPAAEAMENAKELVQLSVKAGYQKIHLDTSMKLGDDPVNEMLSDEVIAERGAMLYKACEDAFQELKKSNSEAEHPVFVIGSEVPIPGGNQEEDDHVHVTLPQDFENTLMAYRKKFHELKMDDAWNYIIAIVVQPGVEFGNMEIHHYNRSEAKPLCDALKHYPDIVFEGHSTDFQAPQALREMVEDGIAILKVGPALTFSLREALFSLSMIEKELIPDEKKRSHLIEVLEKEMISSPENWIKHYHGDENQKKLCRKYSFSDRSRYYMSLPNVQKAIDTLFHNLDEVGIPLYILHQIMPLQYVKVRDGELKPYAKELAKDGIKTMVENYNYAVKINYVASEIFVR